MTIAQIYGAIAFYLDKSARGTGFSGPKRDCGSLDREHPLSAGRRSGWRYYSRCSSPRTVNRFQEHEGFLYRTTRVLCRLAFQSAAVGDVIELLLIIRSASSEEEWADQIHYLPS
jgi:hypothetical protein